MRALASFLAVGLTLAAFTALPDDASTLRTLAEGGRYEVEAGELAGNKGTSDEVKKFGMMMVKDHGAANCSTSCARRNSRASTRSTWHSRWLRTRRRTRC
jgi:predicted outer membrane protein